MSFNKVVIMGNLTRDPEVRTLPSGNSVARLAVAVNRTYNDKDGNKKEEVTYVDVDAFGKQAEIIGKFFTKGKPILIEGRLKLDQWEDKTTGEKKSRLGDVLEGFSFVGGKGDGDSSGGSSYSQDDAPAPRRSAAPAPRQAAPRREAPPAADIGDDDVPF